jgi:site-specific recombinase XerD
VTQLRKKMLEELQRRNYSHRTAKTYVRIVREFATYFHQPPDKLGPEQIRQYQAHLFQAKKLAPATVSQYVSALRFLFVKTLRRHFLAEYIPFPKSRKRLPTVLSPEPSSYVGYNLSFRNRNLGNAGWMSSNSCIWQRSTRNHSASSRLARRVALSRR